MSTKIRFLAAVAVAATLATTAACSSTRSGGGDEKEGTALIGIAMRPGAWSVGTTTERT